MGIVGTHLQEHVRRAQGARLVDGRLQQGAAEPLAACARGGPPGSGSPLRRRRRGQRQTVIMAKGEHARACKHVARRRPRPSRARNRAACRAARRRVLLAESNGATSDKSFSTQAAWHRARADKAVPARLSMEAWQAPAAPPTTHRVGGCRTGQSRRPDSACACAAPVPAMAQAPKAWMRATASANGSTVGGWTIAPPSFNSR